MPDRLQLRHRDVLTHLADWDHLLGFCDQGIAQEIPAAGTNTESDLPFRIDTIA